MIAIILIIWGIALAEYPFQIPANKHGFKENGGPFNLLELKVIHEALSVLVFLIVTIVFFKTEKVAWNYLGGFGFIRLAVFLLLKTGSKKWLI